MTNRLMALQDELAPPEDEEDPDAGGELDETEEEDDEESSNGARLAAASGLRRARRVRRRRPTRTRVGHALAAARPLDYRVPGTVPVVTATGPLNGWASLVAMLLSWRERQAISVEDALGRLGARYLDVFHRNEGLPDSERASLLAVAGLVCGPAPGPKPDDWELLLRESGPLWVAREEPSGRPFSVRARIVVGISGTGRRARVDVIDPASGRQSRVPLAELVGRLGGHPPRGRRPRLVVIHLGQGAPNPEPAPADSAAPPPLAPPPLSNGAPVAPAPAAEVPASDPMPPPPIAPAVPPPIASTPVTEPGPSPVAPTPVESAPEATLPPAVQQAVLRQAGAYSADPAVVRAMMAGAAIGTSFGGLSRAAEATTTDPCEPPYEPAKWNTPSVQPYNNCYNYATDIITNTFAQPGRGGQVSTDNLTCPGATAGAQADGLVSTTEAKGCTDIGCGHVAALVIWPGQDFHWYRRDRYGKWSHKPGSTPARNTDNSGREITNPETCDRGPYTQFCGYFCVCKNRVTIA